LSALPLLYSLIDFDNSDQAWKRYDYLTARELFKTFGVSARLYKEAFEPMLLVGLFAPGEQCSAAATLGMLYYFILAHQPDFDVVWCRGTVGEKIFRPWVQQIEKLGARVLSQHKVTDVIIDSNDQVKGVVSNDQIFDADAVIFSVGVTGMKKMVSSSPSLQNRPEFRNLNNLGAVDVLATRLWFDKKIDIPRPSNACFGFDDSTGWTFFDLNALHDEFKDEPGTVIEADFYHANQFLHLSDQEIVQIVQGYLTKCIPGFREAKVIDSSVIRLANAVTHFAPGSYRYLLPAKTSLNNLFMSGDWIINRHGSWSQEKAYVTGLESANLAISYLQSGEKANILPVEADENHIQFARNINRVVRDVGKSTLPNFWLP
ncbi:MAG: FAD-dependent oxidoreductase, partial [Sphaerospermopsis kisseleviana]